MKVSLYFLLKLFFKFAAVEVLAAARVVYRIYKECSRENGYSSGG